MSTVTNAMEQEVIDAITGGATYTDVDASHISLAISLRKLREHVLTDITPSVQASSAAAVKTVNTQPASAATYPTDDTSSTSGPRIRTAAGSAKINPL